MNRKIVVIITLIITFTTITFATSYKYLQRSRGNNISRISISDDGKLIVWDWFKDICIANSAEPKEYNHFSLNQKFKFRAHQTQISGNGKIITFIGGGGLYVASIKNNNINKINKIEINKNGKPRHLSINSLGNKILLSLMGEKIPKKCSPGWENAVLFSKKWHNWNQSSFIRKVDECDFMYDFRFVSDNQIVYKFRDSDKKAGYIIKTKMKKNGKWCCEKFIDGFGYRLDEISRDGNLFVFHKKILMNHGDSVLTLFSSNMINDSTLSKPMRILSDHKDHIAWGIRLSPDIRNLIWTHLVRGEDGNKIIKREFRIIRYSDGVWSNPEILFDVPENPQIKGVAVSNKNILFTTYRSYKTMEKERQKDGVKTQENKIYFYTTLNKEGELIEIKQKNNQ